MVILKININYIENRNDSSQDKQRNSILSRMSKDKVNIFDGNSTEKSTVLLKKNSSFFPNLENKTLKDELNFKMSFTKSSSNLFGNQLNSTLNQVNNQQQLNKIKLKNILNDQNYEIKKEKMISKKLLNNLQSPLNHVQSDKGLLKQNDNQLSPIKANKSLFNKKYSSTISKVNSGLLKVNDDNSEEALTRKTMILKEIEVDINDKLSDVEFQKILGKTSKNIIKKPIRKFSIENIDPLDFICSMNLKKSKRNHSNFNSKSHGESPLANKLTEKEDLNYLKRFKVKEAKLTNYKNYPARAPTKLHEEKKIRLIDPDIRLTFNSIMKAKESDNNNKHFLPSLTNITPLDMVNIENSIMKKSRSKPRMFINKI